MSLEKELGINLLECGAVGDGAADDTAALERAVAKAEETGFPVYIPAGTYRLTRTITLRAVALVGHLSGAWCADRLALPNLQIDHEDGPAFIIMGGGSMEQLRAISGEHSVGFMHDIYAVEKTRLGIPLIFTGEALHGVCRPDATIFPTPLAQACTFDDKLVEEIGAGIAAECQAYSIGEILAPNLDVSREIRWGRTEETYGEDTYLGARMAYAEQGDDIGQPGKVAVEPKHYCVHGIAEGGHNTAPARAGDREVETEYLPTFEAAFAEAGAYNAMASYNCIDGQPVASSSYYLKDVLRDRWGMRGYVRSDFGAINRLRGTRFTAETDKEAICQAFLAGISVQGFDYPSEVWRGTLKELIEEGRIGMDCLDEAVRRILRVKFDLGLFDNPYVPEDAVEKTVRCEKHLEVARRSARESLCLLKNDGMLPLADKFGCVAVVGPGSDNQFARALQLSAGKRQRGAAPGTSRGAGTAGKRLRVYQGGTQGVPGRVVPGGGARRLLSQPGFCRRSGGGGDL